ncbi:MAG: hypothetical protein HYT76_05135 [Deltaproteobacteria bacterium]|nr:hypothetical protein [Deltaproteobacteria bacterium]
MILLFGFLLEAWSVPSVGLVTTSYLIVFFTVKILENHLFLEGILMRGLWTVVFVFFQKGLVAAFFHEETLFPSWFWLTGQALLHGFVFLGFFYLVSKAEGQLRRRT